MKKERLKTTTLSLWTSQSPRNFFEHLKTILLEVEIILDNADPCLFISYRVICLLFVEYTFFYRSVEYFEKFNIILKCYIIIF